MNVSTRLNVGVFFLVLMLPIGICSAQQEDRCRDILQNGVKNEYSDLTNRDLRSSMRSALCSAYDESHNHKSGGEGGASIPVIGKLQGNYSASQLDSLGSQYCGNSASSLSDSDYTNTMKRVASEKIVDAWGKCMDRQFAGQGGLQSSVETVGSEITFKVKWVPRFNVDSVVVADFYASGATCSKKTIQEGSSIGTEWELAHCTRSGNGAVLITLQAAQNMGSTSQKLDAAEAADAPKTMQVEFRTDHPPIGAPIDGQCPCLSISPSTDNAGHKTANVRNDCSGTVTILGVKDTQSLPAVPESALFRPREGRWFGYAELEQHMTAAFDGTGAVGLFHVEEFSCPGNEMRHILRCQAGQLQPPPAATCYLQDGIVGERCTCPNGANGITTF